MGESSREILPNVRSGGMPLRISGRCGEAVPDVYKCLGDPSRCPRVVGMPSRMPKSGRDALPDFQKWSGNPPKC